MILWSLNICKKLNKSSYFAILIFLARKSTDLYCSVTAALLDVKVAASTTKPTDVTSSISSRGLCKMAGFSARRHFEKSAKFSSLKLSSSENVESVETSLSQVRDLYVILCDLNIRKSVATDRMDVSRFWITIEVGWKRDL